MRKMLAFFIAVCLTVSISGCDSELKKIQELEKQGNWTEAQLALQKAIEKKPDDPRLHNELGFVYMTRGYYEQAFNSYNRAIQLDPYYLEAYYNRGNLYYKLFDVHKAKEDYEKVLSLNPNYDPAYNNLGLLYHLYIKNFDEALKNYKKAIEIEPMNPVYHENISKLHRDMGNMKLAEESAVRAQLLRGKKGD